MEDKNVDKNLNIEDMGEDNNHEKDRKVAVNIVGEMRKSFLDYSMSVIVLELFLMLEMVLSLFIEEFYILYMKKV